MTERMDNKRIAEALSGCRQKREDNTHWDEQDRGNLSSPLNVLETEHALHDLQDARKRVAELEGALEVAQFEVVELVWVTDSAGRTNRLIVLDRKIREAQAALEGK